MLPSKTILSTGRGSGKRSRRLQQQPTLEEVEDDEAPQRLSQTLLALCVRYQFKYFWFDIPYGMMEYEWNMAIPHGIQMEYKWNRITKLSGIIAKTYSIWNVWNH